MTRAIHVAVGVVLMGLVGLGGAGRLQDAQGQSSQDRLARSHEAPSDSAQEMEIQRLRNLVGRLQEQLATYLLQDQQAQKVDNLQASYEQALQQQRALQDEVQRLEAERLKAITELEQLRATRTEQQQEQELRQAERVETSGNSDLFLGLRRRRPQRPAEIRRSMPRIPQ